jgi:ParB family chromosome partitioning protein
MTDHKRSALGKGLSALIPDAPEPRQGVLEVDIDLLQPNTYQPRTRMDDARLEDLVRSIKGNGVIQPIVVHKTGVGYQIIAGERRWRAAQRAGLHRVPVAVREVPEDDPKKLLEMALVENVQREDLNPIEEGHAYRRLADEFSLTQDAIANTVGKDRSTVANMLRLLRLPEEIQHEVADGRLTAGHARALLSLTDEAAQRRLGREIVARSLSVRETEALVKKAGEQTVAAVVEKPAGEQPVDVHTRAAEEKLRLRLGTRVRIVRRGTRGRIEIDFTSEDELIRLFDALTDT